jgi:cytochrome c553
MATTSIAVLLASGVAAATGHAAAGKRKASACLGCHGPNGASVTPRIPSIAGQQQQYLFLQLIQFRERRRISPQMRIVVGKMSDKDFEDLAAYFSAQKPAAAHVPIDPKKVEAGRLVSQREHCESCHMPGFVGQQYVPRLLGQHFAYVRKQLIGFKSQTQADIDGSMTTAAQPLSQEDIENVAHYIASLTPAQASRHR